LPYYIVVFKMTVYNISTGNDNIHAITSQGKYRLRIEMKDFSRNKRYAEYSSFTVANENNKYRLNIGSYSGNAGMCVTLSISTVCLRS